MYEQIPAFNAELAKFNLAPCLLFGTNPSYDLNSKKPVTKVSELKGLRIGHSPVEYVPAFESIGAVSVISPAPEFYERLERGVIDGIFLPNTITDTYKAQEVAPYHTIIGFNTAVIFGMWTNLDMWNKLSPEDQEIFKQAGIVAQDTYHNMLQDEINQMYERWKADGVEILTMEESEIQNWANSMPDLKKQWAAKMEQQGLPGNQIVDLYIELGGMGK
jgi:TRAP-type C4-dicarboxylate transport system substrate-binding protein